MKVLIADDTKRMRIEMDTIMKALGHEVVYLAVDGEDAVSAYEKYEPDLVTMDVNMPKMSGLTALTHIIEMDYVAKVLMVTTNGLEQCVVRAINKGAVGYILKPATVSSVQEAIKKILSRKDVSDPYDEDDLFKDL